ncbi:hypothetical protein [Escherichia coli]
MLFTSFSGSLVSRIPGAVHAIVNDVLMVHRGWSERDALLRKN